MRETTSPTGDEIEVAEDLGQEGQEAADQEDQRIESEGTVRFSESMSVFLARVDAKQLLRPDRDYTPEVASAEEGVIYERDETLRPGVWVGRS